MDNETELVCPACKGTGVNQSHSLEFLCSECCGYGILILKSPAVRLNPTPAPQEDNLDEFDIK